MKMKSIVQCYIRFSSYIHGYKEPKHKMKEETSLEQPAELTQTHLFLFNDSSTLLYFSYFNFSLKTHLEGINLKYMNISKFKNMLKQHYIKS